MIKKPLLIRHVISFKAVVLFFLLVHSRTFSQTSVTRIYTDWNGYWTSNSATGTNNQPNTENNLLAFDWGGKTYATGVNNAALTSRSIAFENSLFRALKIQSLEYTSSTYFLQGSMIDGSLTNRVLTPPLLGTTSVPAELAYRLTDGINGLALGTGIANIKPASASFKVGTNNVLVGAIGDNIPDIVVTQVASPNSTVDKFRFVDSNNVTVGVSVNVNFTSMAVMGTYRLDLFNANNGAPSSTYAANETRDIRILAIDLSSFGITSANAGQIDSFVVDFSGDSDCAFIAFNKNSLKTAEVALVKKASMTGCGKEGSVINYTFEVTNTGQVPLTDIQVTDPKISTISGAPVASLAVGATAVFTGNYTVTAADVALGRVINTAKITALDPSLNIVEDISGNTNNDDIPTSINLLDPPVFGSVKNITCNSLGTIALSNLPSGSWTLERSSASGTVNTAGSGTTFTVTGLAAGTYSFRVTNSTGCKSPSTAGTTISSQTTNTWNGTSWSTGSVPTLDQNIVFTGNYPPAADPNVDLYGCTCLVSGSTAKVTIKTGRTLTITNWVNVATDQNLIIENNASLVQINNASVNSGSIIYKRSSQPMKRYDFTYWSSPVAGQTLYSLSPNTRWDKYLSYTGDVWKEELSSGVMQPGIGYIIRVPEPNVTYLNGESWSGASYAQTLSFTGRPNNGVITSSQYMEKDKYYLIGNPYPSAIHADAFLYDNVHNRGILGGTVYFWTHNTAIKLVGPKYAYVSDDYASYNLTGGVASAPSDPNHNVSGADNGLKPTGYIGAGQSFFASAESGSGNVEFTNEMRYGGTRNSQFFKPGKTSKSASMEKHRLWLNLTNAGGAFKQTLIGYIEGATNTYDKIFDGLTYDGNSYIDFYSINEASDLTIQGRALPFTDADVVPLGYRSTIAGEFTIAIDQADGNLATQRVYLEDKQTGTISELTAKNYTFTTKAGTFKNRFVLRYKNNTLGAGDFETTEDAVSVLAQNKTVTVNSTAENIEKVFLYDLSGKLLYSRDNVNNLQLIMQNLPFAQQVLLVKVVLDNGYQTTKKVIFK